MEKVLYESNPSRRLFLSFGFKSLIVFLLLFLFFGIDFFAKQQTSQAIVYFCLTFILLFLVSLLYLYFLVKSYKYKITDKGIYFSGGIITKREKYVPFFKITNVDVLQTFIDQILGISRLGFQTAGQGASNFPEIKFQGLIDYDKPRKIALKYIEKDSK